MFRKSTRGDVKVMVIILICLAVLLLVLFIIYKGNNILVEGNYTDVLGSGLS